jgi:hypothetical protein
VAFLLIAIAILATTDYVMEGPGGKERTFSALILCVV